MKSVTVREVRQQFSSKVEAPLRRGETLVLRRGTEVLGRIIPVPLRAEAYPDFAARQNKIFGKRSSHLNVTAVLKGNRSRL